MIVPPAARAPQGLDAAALIASAGIDRTDARILLAHASGLTRERLVTAPANFAAPEALARFRALVARRAAGEPLAYLTGTRAFYGRDFAVTPEVLIPRPETELLVDLALDFLRRAPAGAARSPRVLDLGTGSGALAITLLLEDPQVEMWAVDISRAALAVAHANAERFGATLKLIESDWFANIEGIPERFDLIVANPPYIAAGDPHLRAGDLRFEPSIALSGGEDGLAAIRGIARAAPHFMAPGAMLMVEHGWDQAAWVRALLIDAGLVSVASVRDLAGIERCMSGIRGIRGTPGKRVRSH